MRDQREPGYAMAVLGSAKSCLVQLRNAFSTMEGQRGCTTEGAPIASCRAAKNRLTEAVAAHEKSAAAAHGFSNVPICFTS
jgi:hypothetical protein